MGHRFCLVVDDEAGIRTYLKAILESQQIETLEAGNAAQALQLVRKFAASIDIIITDIHMPGEMNGVDLAYSVRHSHPAIPVLLISGGARDKVPASFRCVTKPFRPAAILDALNQMTNREESVRGPHRVASLRIKN